MNYTLMPSLEHRALVRIAITLWNQDDARDLLSKFYLSSSPRFCGEVREIEWQTKVKELKVPLLIPELLKKGLSSILGPIGWQILMWQKDHKDLSSIFFLRENISKLCWTPQGTVDIKKTAEVLLVRNESLYISTRYKLACTYCLEDDIHTLWEQLSGTELYEKNLRMIHTYESQLVSFWSHYTEGEIVQLENEMKRYYESDNINPYQYAFEYSADSGNEVATRYFLQKLTPEEKERILVTTAGRVAKVAYFGRRHYTEPYTDILCFLLCAMDKEQQIQMCKSYPCEVLGCFTNWPWQSIFMETAKHMWTFLTEKEYDRLLSNIVDKVHAGYKDYNYQALFEEFWKQSPTTHKRYVLENCDDSFALEELFMYSDEMNIKLILKDATPILKKNLIFCYWGKDICKDLIFYNEWDLFQFFILECISSKNDMIKFKEELKAHIAQSTVRFRTFEENKWEKFCQLLDDIIENSDNRKLTEEDGHPAKTFCNVEHEKVTHSVEKSQKQELKQNILDISLN